MVDDLLVGCCVLKFYGFFLDLDIFIAKIEG